jgi:hypothetical protein
MSLGMLVFIITIDVSTMYFLYCSKISNEEGKSLQALGPKGNNSQFQGERKDWREGGRRA